jgi:hypothetical protein
MIVMLPTTLVHNSIGLYSIIMKGPKMDFLVTFINTFLHHPFHHYHIYLTVISTYITTLIHNSDPLLFPITSLLLHFPPLDQKNLNIVY